jgi:multidrug efflux pump subunit AcrA (membrane-fusion protein)
VRRVDGRTVVFVLRDDRVERRAVTTGTENSGQVDVLSGLTAGERVVVEGPETLADGDQVRVQGT